MIPSAADLAWVANWREWYPAAFSIRDLQGRIVPFQPSPAQVELFETIQDLQHWDRPRPVRIMYLKARRVRMSTAVAAAISKVLFFVPGQTGIVVAHNLTAAADIFRYYQTFHETYNQQAGRLKILPITRLTTGDSPSLELEGGGWLRVHSATSSSVPRGMSVRFLHMSETAFWPDPTTLCAGLLQGVPNDPSTWVFDESTANGAGTPHHQDWDRRSAGGEGGWITKFFGWNRNPINRMDLNAGEAETITRSLAGPFKEVPLEVQHWREFNLTLEQIKWRRFVLGDLCKGNPETFRQEYPINPQEAFLSSGRSRFIGAMLGRQPLARDPMVGELRMQVLGTQRTPVFGASNGGALAVFEAPIRGKHYAIGVDVASGRENSGGDPDYTVFQVVEVQSGMQVARFRARINPWEAADYLNTLARWYNDALLAIESNGDGRAVIREMLVTHQYPTGLFYMAERAPHQTGPATLDEIGWTTTASSKPVLISMLEGALMDGSMYVRDPVTHGEMGTFVMKSNGRQEAQDGCHDDCVISLALGWLGVVRQREKHAHDLARQQRENEARRSLEWEKARLAAQKRADPHREVSRPLRW